MQHKLNQVGAVANVVLEKLMHLQINLISKADCTCSLFEMLNIFLTLQYLLLFTDSRFVLQELEEQYISAMSME